MNVCVPEKQRGTGKFSSSVNVVFLCVHSISLPLGASVILTQKFIQLVGQSVTHIPVILLPGKSTRVTF